MALRCCGDFLLMHQKDYKIHIPVIEELLKEKYNSLMGIECVEFKKEHNQKLLECVPAYDRYFIAGVKNRYRIHKQKSSKNTGEDVSLTITIINGFIRWNV